MRTTVTRIVLITTTLLVTPYMWAQGLWDMTYPADDFSEEAMLDLSYLNEDVAGQNGFVGLSADGEDFVDGQGTPIRFWAIGGANQASAEAFRSLDDEQLRYFAKFLAKKGVNMIRYHGRIFSVTNDLNEPNRQEIDDIWRAVAAFKQEGIYLTISPFWAGHVGQMFDSWQLGDYQGQIKPWGLMYFNQRFQSAYKSWTAALYTETNPYTGVALKDDPSVAIIQIKNEDGVFFWTIQNVEASLLTEMEQQFYEWIIAKYGTVSAAYSAWSNVQLAADDPENARLGLYILWEATQEQTGGKDTRLTDQMNFYADVQRGFYQEMYEHYRSIGCQQLINATNWKTADPLKLFDAERWTNAVCDVMAVNRYYGPGHSGNNSGWRIEPRHTYIGASVMYEPHKLPINVKQVQGKPFIVTESGWNLPHKYQAEGPFLIAAYMSLTGFDGFYWFNASSQGIDPEPYWDFAQVDGQTPMFRWTISTPGTMDLFPANALIFRKGYVQQAQLLVREERSLSAIYGRETPLISENNSFDPNRDNVGQTMEPGLTAVTPLTYLAGKVRTVYDAAPDNTFVSNELTNLIDFENRMITSSTGEILWDYQQGICTVNTEKAKGLCGFPEQSLYNLDGLTIQTSNEYLSLNVVSLDDLPLSSSQKILIQVGTIYRPTGWTERATSIPQEGGSVDGFEISNVGEMPWQAVKTAVTITLTNPHIQSAFALNQNGYESREVFVEKDETAGTAEIKLPADAMYVIAETRTGTVLETQGHLDVLPKIYPNPSGKRIQVSDSSLAYTDLSIVDLSGKVVANYPRQSDYDLALSPGVYIVQLTRGDVLLHSQRLLLAE